MGEFCHFCCGCRSNNKPSKTADGSRERPSGKRISLQNVIALFDLKTKSTRLPRAHKSRANRIAGSVRERA
ncbi:hypothetical protein RR48_07526 [Papilio machaon]|uniref:Uncharacterized protein n=1 Tax=Papilio machaon TaxID=76193 RepID=A0A194RV70_PAPMA|nr:hypothetical protein RR48_07526 [Papilio machaon]